MNLKAFGEGLYLIIFRDIYSERKARKQYRKIEKYVLTNYGSYEDVGGFWTYYDYIKRIQNGEHFEKLPEEQIKLCVKVEEMLNAKEIMNRLIVNKNYYSKDEFREITKHYKELGNKVGGNIPYSDNIFLKIKQHTPSMKNPGTLK